MTPSTYPLHEAAQQARKQAEAYEALANQLKIINQGQQPAPMRELESTLRAIGFCIVPSLLLETACEYLDPHSSEDSHLSPGEFQANQMAYASRLRAILNPEPATNQELPV